MLKNSSRRRMNPLNPYIYIYISEFETPPRPPIEFEPLPSGPEKVVLHHDRDPTTISHDESLQMENTWAMELDEAPTLESKEKDSLDVHGSFTLEIPEEPCSFNASPESGMLGASRTHTRKAITPRCFPSKSSGGWL